jgi:hypothetical protein
VAKIEFLLVRISNCGHPTQYPINILSYIGLDITEVTMKYMLSCVQSRIRWDSSRQSYVSMEHRAVQHPAESEYIASPLSPDWLRVQSSLLHNGYHWIYPKRYRGRSMILTTHPYPESRFKMYGSLSPCLLYAFITINIIFAPKIRHSRSKMNAEFRDKLLV